MVILRVFLHVFIHFFTFMHFIHVYTYLLILFIFIRFLFIYSFFIHFYYYFIIHLFIFIIHPPGIDVHELDDTDLPLNEISLTFDEFCCIVAEFKNPHLENKPLWDILSHSLQRVIGESVLLLLLFLHQYL